MTEDLQTQNDELTDTAAKEDPAALTLEEREALLVKKEADLSKKESEIEASKINLRFRYKLYDRVNVSVKTMNIVIILLVIVLLLLVAYGIYDARN